MAGEPQTGAIVRTIIGSVLTAVVGIPFLVMLVLVIGSAIGPPARDPHGYTMIFGTMMLLAAVLPLAIGVLLLLSGIRSLRRGRGIEGAGYDRER